MRGEFLIHHLTANPLAVMRERLPAIVQLVARVSAGQPAAAGLIEGIRADNQVRAARRVATRSVAGPVAVVQMHGMMTQRPLADISGGGTCSTMQVGASIRDALADDSVSSILLDIDSPGGEVFGVQELAGIVAQATARKPVTAIANSLCCSAAYWVASQASEVYVGPGGIAGSIGVYSVHEDISRALDAAGVTTTLIKAGRFKAEGNSLEPLSPADRDARQGLVDAYYAAFVSAVAAGRKVGQKAVREGFGQGRALVAEEAVRVGLADGIATLGGTIGKMQGRARRALSRSGPTATVTTALERREAWLDEQRRSLDREGC